MIHFTAQSGNTYGVCFVEGQWIRFYRDGQSLGERQMVGGKVLWFENDCLYEPDIKQYVERLAKLTAFI